MNDTLQTLLRSVFKFGSAALVTHGIITADQITQITTAFLGLSPDQQIGAGLLIAVGSVWWGVVHRTPAPATAAAASSTPAAGKIVPLHLLGALACFLCILVLPGCATALNSNKIVSVKQRCFGLVVETASSTSSTPNVKLGFCSTVWQMIPTSTNALFAPAYADTFDLTQSVNPFATGITENTGAGTVGIGTNGVASYLFPK